MGQIAKKATGLKNVLKVDKGEVRAHLDGMVRASVEQTLNGLLEAEADRRDDTNGRRSEWTGGLAVTYAGCRRRRGR